MTPFDAALPLAAAPMAGGPSTPELVRAVSAAGAFGFLAGGYRSAEQLAADIDEVRGDAPAFGVNLFVPSGAPCDADEVRAYARRLEEDARRAGVALDPDRALVPDDDAWDDKLALLRAHPVPVVSLTFGLPSAADIASLRRAGSVVLASVTTPAEARLAEEAGVDGLVVQGPRAGGHSACFDPRRTPTDAATADIVRTVRASSARPLVAAGGTGGAPDVRALRAAGADAVAVGTLFLTADEAGTSSTHRRALADPRFDETVLTRAFTGRPARALRNAFADRHGNAAPAAYPAVHHLTRGLRRAAGASGDPEALHLWAGTGYRAAVRAPAADIVASLAEGV
ncbi:nitronate monooxygenase [Microbacterium sp. ZXX196]|uniref:nitronate monooxygenase n=1 Tax=Microbacterium sp. ZXX196 TaxID=2609291 RepID=UPI001E347FF6|nr:nitronate monooxygenase [Microbacterium sp. ZXX196]